MLAAWRGREEETSALIDATLAELASRDEGFGVSACQWLEALLHVGLGQFERALASAQQVLEPPRQLDAAINMVLPEVVEAAAVCGQAQVARDALAQLAAMTRPSGRDWGLGLEAAAGRW